MPDKHKRKQKHADYREFLPEAMALERRPVNVFSRILIWGIAGLFITALLWAWLSSLDIVTVASGKVEPHSKTRVVQSMVKAAVSEIHVSENDMVKDGQLLVSLEDADMQAELLRLQQHEDQLRKDEQRYRKLMQWLENSDQNEIKSGDYLLLAQWHLYLEKKAEIAAMQVKLQAEKKRTRLEFEKYASILPILTNKEKNLKKLADKNMSSNQQYLDQKQLRLETGHDMQAAKVRLEEIQASIDMFKQKQVLLMQQTYQEYAQKHKTSQESLQSVVQEIIKQQQVLDHYRLTAASDGKVHQLAVRGTGEVVMPAQQMMMIVPGDAVLEISALVKNSDIGFLHENQDVQIKIDAYPFTRYGLLHGKLVTIGSDAIVDEQQGLVYKIKVRPEKSYLDYQHRQLALVPGMTVSVEVITGKRRLLDYFLSPLQRYAAESIRER